MIQVFSSIPRSAAASQSRCIWSLTSAMVAQ